MTIYIQRKKKPPQIYETFSYIKLNRFLESASEESVCVCVCVCTNAYTFALIFQSVQVSFILLLIISAQESWLILTVINQ